jgi:hypothetical protein
MNIQISKSANSVIVVCVTLHTTRARAPRQAILHDFVKTNVDDGPPKEDMWEDWSEELRAAGGAAAPGRGAVLPCCATFSRMISCPYVPIGVVHINENGRGKWLPGPLAGAAAVGLGLRHPAGATALAQQRDASAKL